MIYKVEPVRKMYDHTSVILVPWTSRTGQLTTNIPQKVREELEEKLGYPKDELAPNSEFLYTYRFAVNCDGTTIDDSTPHGALQYQFCKHHYLIADGKNNIKPDTIAVLTNEDTEAELENVKNQRQLDALEIYRNMSQDEIRKCLRVLGYKSSTMSINLTQTTLFNFINKSHTNVELFYAKWVDNADKDYEFLLEQAVASNVIRKNKTTYYYGTDVLGSSKEDVIQYLKHKNNVDILKAIKQGIEVKVNI